LAVVLGIVLVVLLGLGAAWLMAASLPSQRCSRRCNWLLVRGLTRVGRDRHGCEGHIGKSLGWDVLWASLYTAPLAVIVWLARGLLAS
jgi:hypothetical protein